MAVDGWILDKSASSRVGDPSVAAELDELAGQLYICPVGELEYLYSARSSADYDALKTALRGSLNLALAPPNIFESVLALQHELAHHHGMWHRVAIPDLFIAEIALSSRLGVLHLDGDFERIAEVRPLTVRRLGRA